MKKLYINMVMLLLLLNVLLVPQNIHAGDKITDAIKYTVTPNKQTNLFPYSGTRAFKDESYRLELAEAFKKAASYFDLPIGILIAIGYRESIFRPGLTGPNDEKGIMQVGKYGRKKCKEYCFEIDTINGGIMCGACWLDMGRQWCKGDLIKGLRAYLSGKCESTAVLTSRVLRQRLKIWTILAKIMKQ
jgi:hypothetical protein